MLLRLLPVAAALAGLVSLVRATDITDIQGPAFLSPLNGQKVHNVTGVVTAIGDSGFFLQGTPSSDVRKSAGLRVFTTSKTILAQIAVGDLISLDGKVNEFRSSTAPNDLFGTELGSPANITVIAKNSTITPVVIGKHRLPPTQQLSALDVAAGHDGWLAVPNNQSQIDAVNATLQPHKFGLDFWESLEGQLITVPAPTAIDFENSFGEFWVYGDWPVTGKNSRNTLTLTLGPDGIPDANPEVIIVGSPLDGTDNPSVALGTTLSDITGVVVFQFGFFYVLPLTAPSILTKPNSTVPPTTLVSTKNACEITFGDYNVENLGPTTAHLPTIATHIAQFLRMPDMMFLQEIQDDDGPTNDGVVTANVTLQTLVNAIANITNITYSFVNIPGVNNADGGEPGGNIRQAYLWNPKKISLVSGAPVGTALEAVHVTGSFLNPKLSLNPGRIEPNNSVWEDSRKPLAAEWQTANGHRFFTVNLHLESKGGSTTEEGNARPPVNLPVEKRTGQVNVTANFVKQILAKDPSANVIVAGDCNEYTQTRSVFHSFKGILNDIDVTSGVPQVERYTYVFDMNTEQLDHIFISDAIASRGTEVEHVHVNQWAPSIDARTSDHDPTVARVKVC
ncbi:DNase I-like protein [Punctularia strigosozonata HHB-11173 SS5]|uniref:DNase I-like protein n=1 Tax=Punctularia strigosozonata (strain HHB-11173) TaxID=741275 RepID=UPI000441640F|nr:DNase I-like protein [Punctularia strigosozonata HHB-11173 SS5]EIN06964.1 DNase I-like protein [Punctularia strigosozonata HHB-11173 SS5]